MTEITMTISGMTCGHCVGSVTRALNELDGVAVEQVSVGSAKLAYDGGKTSPADITQAIENEGYRVTSTA